MKTNRLLLLLFLSISINIYSQKIRPINDFLTFYSGNPGGNNAESIVFQDKLFFTVGTSTNVSTNNSFYTRFHYTDGSQQFQIKWGSGAIARYILGVLPSPNFTIFQDQLYFTARREAAGSSEGYRLVYGDSSGVYNEFIAEAGIFSAENSFTDIEVLNSATMYFGGSIDAQGLELHKYVKLTSAPGVLTRITDINPNGGHSNIKNLFTFSGEMYFSAFDGTAQELYKVNTSDEVTKIAIAGETIEDPEELTLVDNKLYFSANDGNGRELFEIDSSNQVVKINFSSDNANPTSLTAFDFTSNGNNTKVLAMAASTTSSGRELMVLNTNNNVPSLVDVNPNAGSSNPEKLYVYNNYLYFSADVNVGRELYKFDGSAFSIVANINTNTPTASSTPKDFIEYEGKLFFNAFTFTDFTELWQLDENDNLSIVKSHRDGQVSSDPKPLRSFDGKLYMSAEKDNNERELYAMSFETKILATADTDWNNENNWDFGLPDEFLNAVIDENVALNITDFVKTKDLIVSNNSAKINIQPKGALTVEGNTVLPTNTTGVLNLFSNSLNEYGTYINKGTYLGDKIVYHKYFTDAIDFGGSPFSNSAISTIVADLENSGNNAGIGIYNNSYSGRTGFEYYTIADANNTTFEEGRGYVLDRNGSGVLDFEGIPFQNDLSYNITTGSQNGWNLLSNAYTSFISAVDRNSDSVISNTTLLNNSNAALDANYYAIYYYDASMNKGNGGFNAINFTNYYSNLAPGQAFFVKANSTSSNLDFKLAAQNHGFNNPNLVATVTKNVTLFIENMNDATQISSTKVSYETGGNFAFNFKYDAARFDLVNDDEFFIATKLVQDNAPVTGLNYQIQAVFVDFGEIVPISIKAKASTEIEFSMEKEDFPTDIDVYIEDRENQVFYKLETTTDTFSINLTNDLNGAGRFYLHTANQTPLSTDSYNIDETLYVYSVNNKIIINGLNGLENSVSVFDVLGKKVAEVDKNTESNLEIVVNSKLTKAVYFVNIETNKKVISKKILLK
jgi:ELWxxDGT repeat protein